MKGTYLVKYPGMDIAVTFEIWLKSALTAIIIIIIIIIII